MPRAHPAVHVALALVAGAACADRVGATDAVDPSGQEDRAVPIVSGEEHPHWLVGDERGLYWFANEGDLRRWTPELGDVTLVQRAFEPAITGRHAFAMGSALDGGSVYWSAWTGPGRYALATTDRVSGTTLRLDSPDLPLAIAVDPAPDGRLYFTRFFRSELSSSRKDGTDVALVAQAHVNRLAFSGAALYFTESLSTPGCLACASARLWRYDLHDGVSRRIAEVGDTMDPSRAAWISLLTARDEGAAWVETGPAVVETIHVLDRREDDRRIPVSCGAEALARDEEWVYVMCQTDDDSALDLWSYDLATGDATVLATSVPRDADHRPSIAIVGPWVYVAAPAAADRGGAILRISR